MGILNVNAPFGAEPIMMGNGAPWNGRVNRYYIPSTDVVAYYVGDFVISAADADANGVPAIAKAAAGDKCRGVIVAIEPVPPNATSLSGADTNLAEMFVPATKTHAYYVLVCDDLDVVFRIRGDTTGTNQIAANVNKNANFTVAVPNPAKPFSATVLNSGSIAVTFSLSLKLYGLQQIPGNDFGASALWLFRFNTHELGKTGTTAI